VSEPNEAMLQLAERLEGMVEELADMGLDALRRATSGDPDSIEAGEALAMERRLAKARRALEKSIVVLSEGSRGDQAALDGDGAA
jgi:hypothetical protein